jgi:hypothetical protein
MFRASRKSGENANVELYKWFFSCRSSLQSNAGI